jgi:hypothetical protein
MRLRGSRHRVEALASGGPARRIKWRPGGRVTRRRRAGRARGPPRCRRAPGCGAKKARAAGRAACEGVIRSSVSSIGHLPMLRCRPLDRSVGETRAIGQSSRVFAGGQPLPMAPVIVPRHVRSSRSGSARSRQPRAARTLHRTVVHPRSRPRGYAASSPAPWPRPAPSSSSPSTLRRSTRLFQYGGPRPGDRCGISVASPTVAR